MYPTMISGVGKEPKFFRDQRSLRPHPCRGTDADVKVVRGVPSYVYHTNAWRRGRGRGRLSRADPLMGDPTNPERSFTVLSIGLQRLEPYLHGGGFNLKTGRRRSGSFDVMIGSCAWTTASRREVPICCSTRGRVGATVVFEGPRST